jgi:hypothetical protein
VLTVCAGPSSLRAGSFRVSDVSSSATISLCASLHRY